MPPPLVAAKQVVPPVRRAWVARERLRARLRRNLDTRLTVVVAPAGWGKTTLLSQWAHDATEPRPVVWVSLDEADDEPVRFWTYVVGALRRAQLDFGGDVLAALTAPGLEPVDVALPTLLNELAAASVDRVLVLDDYHVLSDPRIHEGVEFLLAYLPDSLRLVIASRTDPPLPLARLRARGDLTEVRATDLRFRDEEAAELVAAVADARLDPTSAAVLCERTEGWAAGLQLAALTMRDSGRPVVALSGEQHLLDYFQSEVLDRLTPDDRDLLVRTSVVERFCGSLSDFVLEREGSTAALRELDRRNVFVAAVDGSWFRCHQLFRDALRRELDATHPGLAPQLLGRAARWFRANGHVEEAIACHLAAGDTAAAAAELKSTVRWFLDHAAAATYLRLGEALLPALDPPDPEILLHLVFAATLGGRFDRVPAWLDAIAPLVASDAELPGWGSLRAGFLSRRAIYGYTSHGDLAAALTDAEEAARLETDPTLPGYAASRGAVGAILLAGERFTDAAATLTEAWRCPGRSRLPAFIALQAAGVLSLCLVRTGEVERARRLLDEIDPDVRAAESRWGDAAAAAVVHVFVARGRLAYNIGDIGSARSTLRRAADLASIWGQGTILVAALASLADAELAAGDRAAARDALTRGRELVDAEPVYPFARHELEAAQARLGRGATRAARRSGRLVEELTDRETAILHALRGTATQREIGAALFLSVNTVKGYTKSLYRKLGVVTRQDAIDEARALGLI